MSVICTYCTKKFHRKTHNARLIVCKNNSCLLWFHNKNAAGKKCLIEWMREQHHLTPDHKIDDIVGQIQCNCGSHYIGVQTKNFELIESSAGMQKYHTILNQHISEFILKNACSSVIPDELKEFTDQNKLLFTHKFYYDQLSVDSLIPHIRGSYHGRLKHGEVYNIPEQILRPLAIMIRLLQKQLWETEEELRKILEMKMGFI